LDLHNTLKSALVISFTHLERDPRILRQIDWLSSNGWQIDALGLGAKPESISNMYSVALVPSLRRYLAYLFLKPSERFDSLYGNGLPLELGAKLKSYDLVILNELEYAPLTEIQKLESNTKKPILYIDLHENHLSTAASNVFEMFAFSKYWKWQLAKVDDLIASYSGPLRISSVESRIAKRYSNHFRRDVSVIRNAPSWHDLAPSETFEGRLRLVHHGMGTRNRGIETTIRAISSLPNVSLDLYLVAGRFYKLKLEILTTLTFTRKRVHVHQPVPTIAIPETINKYDLASVIIPPATENHLHALPNKFFESIQGRLAIVTGPNPSMAEIVDKEDIGVVLEDWSVRSLRTALKSIRRDDILKWKMNSDRVSSEYSSDSDREKFLRIISS